MFAVNYNNKILTLETLITFSNIGIDIFCTKFLSYPAVQKMPLWPVVSFCAKSKSLYQKIPVKLYDLTIYHTKMK